MSLLADFQCSQKELFLCPELQDQAGRVIFHAGKKKKIQMIIMKEPVIITEII